MPVRFPSCPRCPLAPAGPPASCVACALPPSAVADTARCAACGAPRPPATLCASAVCQRADRGWSVVWSLGAYEGALRRVLVDYKYRGRTGWAPLLGRLVAGWLEVNATSVEEFDVLVPVPAYTGPGARRRDDHVARLATEAVGQTGGAWQLLPAVTKRAETPPMARAARFARRGAAEGALRASLEVADAGAVRGAKVLVFDDVMSSGATMREVARLLRAAGADEVAGLVVARAVLAAPFVAPRTHGRPPVDPGPAAGGA